MGNFESFQQLNMAGGWVVGWRAEKEIEAEKERRAWKAA